MVWAIIAAGAMTRVDASTAVTNLIEVSFFWRLLLDIKFLPLAPDRHEVAERVALGDSMCDGVTKVLSVL